MFDVFLSHNSQDRAAVEAIANRLRAEAGLQPFLDKWHLVPGETFQPAIERGLAASKSIAVFIGRSGFSPWHQEELRAGLATAVRTGNEFRVIPVLLPGGDEKDITGFLAQRTWVDFRDGLDLDGPFRRLVAGITGRAVDPGPVQLPDEPAPYRGLFKFERRHSSFFFGRSQELQSLAGKLERSTFGAVVGASGVGKSSLVLAGVLPRLERLEGWAAPIRTFAFSPGERPLRALADQIATLVPHADRLRCADDLELRMRERPDGLRTAVQTLIAGEPGTMLLVVDQLEELFTQVPEREAPEAVVAFASNLRDAAEHGHGLLRIIATVRADFFDRCLSIAPLRSLLQDRDFLLGPMSPEGLREAVMCPAAAVGAHFETGVVSALLGEIERRPPVLPLLAHALDLLWRARRGAWLTFAAYEAMGGVAGALRQHADACWERLAEADRPVARDILLRLVSVGEGAQDTKRRVKLDELYTVGAEPSRVARVLQELSGPEARLLVVDRHEVEVVHEILIQVWPTLRAWVDGARHRLRVHRRLTEAAREWDEHGRSPGYLLAGARLAEVEERFGPGSSGLTPLEVALLSESRQASERSAHLARESRRQQLRARALQRALLVIGSATAIALGFVLASRAETDHERRRARSRELATAAEARLATDPQLALLLIQEAYRTEPTEQVNEALRAYQSQPGRMVIDTRSGSASSVAFSSDGRWIVTAGAEGVARIWDASSGRELRQLKGHSDWVTSAAFSPDDRRVVTAGRDRTARIWSAADGQEVQRLEGHQDWVNGAAFSPDGRLVVTAGRDGTARVWDAAGREIGALRGHEGAVLTARFSPDGRRVVTGGADGTVRVWDLETGQQRRVLRGHAQLVNGVSFSPAGGLLVSAGADGTVCLWSASSWTMLGTLVGHAFRVNSAAFSRDGKLIVTAGADGTSRLWEAATRREVARLEGHSGWVNDAALSGDGRRLVTAGADGKIRIWEGDGWSEMRKLEAHSGWVNSVAFSPDGRRAVTSGQDGTARVWDVASSSELGALVGHRGAVLVAAFSPDGHRVVTAGADGTARLWDSTSYGEVMVLNARAGAVPYAAFGPSGARVVTAGEDGRARLWDASSGRELQRLEGHRGRVTSAAFSPDGQRVATAAEDGTVRLWDAASGQEMGRLEGHSGTVLSVAFSPLGRILVTAGQDGTARVWDAAQRTEVGRLVGHGGAVWSVAFSRDGRWVVTASDDSTARIWEMATLSEVGRLEPRSGGILNAAFSPDGSRVATAGTDAVARLWPRGTWEPVDQRLLTVKVGRSLTCSERRIVLHERACSD